MKRSHFIWIGLFLLMVISACEEDITLDLPQGEESLVIEGYIEQGMPPIVMVTRTLPYFSASSVDILNGIFVSGANVRIYDGKDTIKLLEINLSSLPDSLAKILLEVFQLSGDKLSGLNITIYTSNFDIVKNAFEIVGVVNTTYTLFVDKDEHQLKATTTIPPPVKIDSVWCEPHPNPMIDSLFLVKFAFKDPANQGNNYRLFNSRNKEPYYPNAFFSVADDKLVNGQRVELNVVRGLAAGAQFNEGFGFYKKGDSVNVKLCAIDKAHYDFWNTFESTRFSGGPFANPIYLLSNVKGGLGIWGGYGAYYYPIVVGK